MHQEWNESRDGHSPSSPPITAPYGGNRPNNLFCDCSSQDESEPSGEVQLRTTVSFNRAPSHISLNRNDIPSYDDGDCSTTTTETEEPSSTLNTTNLSDK